jgi:hypothetical protein
MITLACFVAVGLNLAMFFNVYALSALSMLVAQLNFTSAFNVGIGHAAMSVGLQCCPSPNRILRRPLGVGTILCRKDCIDPYVAKMTPRSFYRCGLDQIKSGASVLPHPSLRQFVSISLMA